MKIYRRSFWKASTTTANVIPMSLFFIIFSPVFPSIEDFLFFLLVMTTWLIPLFITQYFYVMFTDDEFVLKNGILSFWQKKYKYNDITKVSIINRGGLSRDYIHIKIKDKKIWGKYVIDLVSPNDYRSILKDLEEKGLIVENKIGSMMPLDPKK